MPCVYTNASEVLQGRVKKSWTYVFPATKSLWKRALKLLAFVKYFGLMN